MTRYQTYGCYLRRWATTSDNCAASSKQRLTAELVRGEPDHHVQQSVQQRCRLTPPCAAEPSSTGDQPQRSPLPTVVRRVHFGEVTRPPLAGMPRPDAPVASGYRLSAPGD